MSAGTKLSIKRRQAFLTALAATGNVSRSAESIGTSRIALYKLRRADAEFAGQWDEALDSFTLALEDEARRRAFEGTDKPVFYKGNECGYIREFSDTLMIFLLKGARPEKYRDHLDVTSDGKQIQQVAQVVIMPTTPGDQETQP